MTDPAARAAAFCREETAFRLGALVTESSHPKTAALAETAQSDLPAAIRQLQSVDRDLPPVLASVLAGDAYAKLASSIEQALRTDHRVFASGCGATGRLALLLESLWRRACAAPERAHLRDRVFGFMAGGDYALIKSVEGFEDHPSFGRRQLSDADPEAGDVLIAVTEGGETPFVIGTAWEALSRGMPTFFVFNNPAALLRERVQRSRELLDDPRVTALDLTTGPMAVAGSTRMQATTIELAVVGAALEDALLAATDAPPRPAAARVAAFGAVLGALEKHAEDLAAWAELEAEVYSDGGRARYTAGSLLLDVLTDTTERSPTFSLPPFRPAGDTASPRPWAVASSARKPADRAWGALLGRPVRGIPWGPGDYAALGAPALAARPPSLGADAVLAFDLGRGADDGPRRVFRVAGPGDAHGRALRVDEGAEPLLRLPLPLDPGPLDLPTHLAAKLALNTVSTATMAAAGRLAGNWMVHVRASNKKLIDRGIRLLVDRLGLPYEEAAERLFAAQAEVDAWPTGEEPPSPVALVIRRSRLTP